MFGKTGHARIKWANMRTFVFTLILMYGPAWAGGHDQAPPPPGCPQCGDWQIDSASRGLAGELILIGQDRIELPVLGTFCAHVLEQATATEYAGRRYHMRLGLSPDLGACTAPGEASLRMDIETSTGVGQEASQASIEVRGVVDREPVLVAHAWNYERESPCDSGEAGPFMACDAVARARSYKRLAYLAYDIARSLPRRQATQFVRGFNPTAFAIDVMTFCDRRSAGRGGGNWTAFWSKTCQTERIEAKLLELEGWQACLAARRPGCKMPTQRFDRSKDPEAGSPETGTPE